jgi:hypothetical protein
VFNNFQDMREKPQDNPSVVEAPSFAAISTPFRTRLEEKATGNRP